MWRELSEIKGLKPPIQSLLTIRIALAALRQSAKFLHRNTNQRPSAVVLTMELLPARIGLEGRLSAQALMSDPVPNSHLHRLPLVTLYLTERCNSRCVTCDYWRHGRADMNLDAVQRLLPSLAQLRHPGRASVGRRTAAQSRVARRSRRRCATAGLKVWLLTSGLSLAKHARRAARAIRCHHRFLGRHRSANLPGHSRTGCLRQGLRRHSRGGAPRRRARSASHGATRELQTAAGFCVLGEGTRRAAGFLSRGGCRQSSRLWPHRGLQPVIWPCVPKSCPCSTNCCGAMERECAADFRSGFIAESPAKLRPHPSVLRRHPRQSAYPPVRCNAPEFSAVVGATGRVQPCFFISGPAEAALPGGRHGTR